MVPSGFVLRAWFYDIVSLKFLAISVVELSESNYFVHASG